MFYSLQICTFLAESLSNYGFKEEKKIDLDSNKTKAVSPRGVLRNTSVSFDVKNFKKYLRRSSFFKENKASRG